MRGMPGLTAEEVREQLHQCCVREYTRASADPSPDRKVGRRAVLAAEARINAISTELTAREFLDAAWAALEELHQQYSRDDVLDPDGWGAGAIGAVQNEILDLRREGR